jgi:hypothetical protein
MHAGLANVSNDAADGGNGPIRDTTTSSSTADKPLLFCKYLKYGRLNHHKFGRKRRDCIL